MISLNNGLTDSMVQPVILHVENVTRQFSIKSAPAVNAVTLKLYEGEILGLLGPSGCGKTTLLRLIAGFECPQSGTIELAGQTVAGNGQWLPPERRDVGMVFQDYALFPHLTLAGNVSFGLKNRRRFRRYTPKQIQQRVQEAIALVGLEGLENRYPHELSGGQQQRVALARALAPQPSLVLLDEPLSNLDVQVRLRLRQEVRDILKQTGTSAVFVTHDQEEALSICDQVAVIRSGQIEQFGTPEVIYREPASRFVAEFVTQANLIPCQWNGSKWETEIGCFRGNGAEAKILEESKITGNPQTPSGELFVRQEDLHLEPDEDSKIVISDRQFLGREHRYSLLTPAGLKLNARALAEIPLPIGSRVRVIVSEATPKVFLNSGQGF